jgi:capsid protein
MIAEWIDSFVGLWSPARQLQRVQARRAVERYQGGERSRLTSRAPKNQSADSEAMGPYGADSLRAWSRMLVRDNAYAWGVVDTIVSSVVGTGIQIESMAETDSDYADDENTNEKRNETWQQWCETCDINGQFTFDELQAIVMREMVEAGEVLIHHVTTDGKKHNGIYRPVPYAIELIEADPAGQRSRHLRNQP